MSHGTRRAAAAANRLHQSLGRSSGRRDLGFRRGREFVRRDGQFFLQFPRSQNFDRIEPPLHQSAGLESRRIDRGPLVERLFERAEIDDGHDAREEFIAEAALGQPPHEGHLPSLEGKPMRVARVSRVPLVAAPGRLPMPGPRPAPHALAVLPFDDLAMHVIDNHVTATPRNRAICSFVLSFSSALSVARTRFMGLVEPRLLVSASCTPADSRTARTVFPAMTPVPGRAGIKTTRAAPNRPSTVCGIVVSWSATWIELRLVVLTAFSTACGTSEALPYPQPTFPRLSPSTTSAVNVKRRPPLTTQAQRRIWMTFS